MPPGLIVLVIIVGISLLITVASNWLRNQQRQLETAAAEKRARARAASSGGSSAGRPAAGDIDRFLEEINKLRQKPAAEPVAAKPARKAEPVKPAKAAAAPTVARRVEAPPARPVVTRLDDLPVAPVVARLLPPPPPPPPPPPSVVAKPAAPKAARAVAQTPFGRQLVGLLSDPKSLPTAVVLQEVLGPPKCRQRPGQRVI